MAQTIMRVVAAEFEKRAARNAPRAAGATSRPMRVEPVAEISGNACDASTSVSPIFGRRSTQTRARAGASAEFANGALE